MEKKKRSFLEKIKNKYRLVIYNDQTFEESISFRLSRLNVFITVGSLAILLVVATTFIIAFTPLKEYIPGYGSFDTNREINNILKKTDSLENIVNTRTHYINNLKSILSGEDIPEDLEKPQPVSISKDINFHPSKADSLLRAEIESQPGYNLTSQNYSANELYQPSSASIKSFFFFSPLNGIVSDNYDPTMHHYGVDIVADNNEAVKATLDGTVILSTWTLETGYSIAVQHTNNLISVYKHNSVLLKKQGEYVKAGDVIGIIGETGTLSTGVHLHFELWFNGIPLNPRDYISFN